MTDSKEMILEDALSVAISAEKKCVKKNGIIVVLLSIICALCAVLVKEHGQNIN